MCDNINRDIEAGIVEHDFHKHTDIAAGSIINAVVNGYRFSGDRKGEEEFYRLKSLTEKITESFSDPVFSLAISYDWIAGLPFFKQRFQKVLNIYKEVHSFLYGIIEDHVNDGSYLNEAEPRVSTSMEY